MMMILVDVDKQIAETHTSGPVPLVLGNDT
jgi:hypothetical protein